MIKVVYRTEIAAICPVDGSRDIYRVTIRSDWLIPVEEILATIAAATGDPVYQENLTQTLADEIGAKVITTGRHSGVETRCTAWPEPLDPERSEHGHT
jgi:hypothetical protein